MNIWLVRLICAPLAAIIIILLIIRCEECSEFDNLIFKIVMGIALIVIIWAWYGEEMED